MRIIAAIFFAFITGLALVEARADVVGRASVVDGDTIEVHGQRIRLYGIDAPESEQTCQRNDETWRCGQQAALALAGKIGQRAVACEEKDRDRYSRVVAKCSVDDEDLSEWLTHNGWAVAYVFYTYEYTRAEAFAKSSRRGIWSGEFIYPWKWRQGVRPARDADDQRDASDPSDQPDDCSIKGNISSSGERIYHVPGGQYYERTKINLSKGERWFCSEAEALAAGWRRSMQERVGRGPRRRHGENNEKPTERAASRWCVGVAIIAGSV